MRLIDADELISYLNSVAGCFDSTREVEDNTIEAIGIAPTIDAIPVVRCKDCKYFEDCETYCLCTNPEKGWHTKEDNYCESGERK